MNRKHEIPSDFEYFVDYMNYSDLETEETPEEALDREERLRAEGLLN